MIPKGWTERGRGRGQAEGLARGNELLRWDGSIPGVVRTKPRSLNFIPGLEAADQGFRRSSRVEPCRGQLMLESEGRDRERQTHKEQRQIRKLLNIQGRIKQNAIEIQGRCLYFTRKGHTDYPEDNGLVYIASLP